MNNQTAVTEKKASKMSNKRKAKLFDEFMLKLAQFASAYAVIQCLEGSLERDEVFNSDFEEVLNPLLDLLTEKETDEVLMRILPKTMENDLVAKKVTIKW